MLFTVDIIHRRFNQTIASSIFFLFSPRKYIIAINRINCSIIIFCFAWKFSKFENIWTFKHCVFRNLRIDVLASVLFSSTLIDQNENSMTSCFDENLYYYKKINSFVWKTQILTSPKSSRYHCLLLIFCR